MALIQHILHIDDDEEDYMLLKEAVRTVDENITVTFMSECPSKTKAMRQKPDMVFLDINMYENDGYYWLEGLRAKGLVDLPIIMYSTANSHHYIEKAYQKGANLFLVKPDTFTRLVATMEVLLGFNWQDPHRIKEAHFIDGKYHPFSLSRLAIN